MSRVALLVNFIPPYRVPLFEALQARVGELRVFVSTPVEPNRHWPAQWGSLNVVVQRSVMIRTHWSEPGGRLKEVRYVHLPYDTLLQLRRFRPDAIISGELGLRTVLATIYKRWHPNVRLVTWVMVSERTERHRGTVSRLLRPHLLRCADSVLVNGASGARYVKGLGVPDERIVFAPYTTDITAFRAVKRPNTPERPDGPVRLLFVGTVGERKGLFSFMRVLHRWAEHHPATRVEFRIVGDGPHRSALERLVGPPNLDVRFLLQVPYEQLPHVYKDADMLVFPTFADEWGMVVNEALAAGLPVLGSVQSQAVEELVADTQTGWTFDPEIEESVYAALDRALHTSEAERSHMGALGRQRALELTPSIVAEKIADTLQCSSPRSS
jgi:glycosyltransferase involved in cell wall biosynthesis